MGKSGASFLGCILAALLLKSSDLRNAFDLEGKFVFPLFTCNSKI